MEDKEELMNKEELMTLPMPQGTLHCSCLEHCFLFMLASTQSKHENTLGPFPPPTILAPVFLFEEACNQPESRNSCLGYLRGNGRPVKLGVGDDDAPQKRRVERRQGGAVA